MLTRISAPSTETTTPGELVKSIPAGIDRVKNFKFRVTIPELREMFDGSEQARWHRSKS